jgi:hypothetical protein
VRWASTSLGFAGVSRLNATVPLRLVPVMQMQCIPEQGVLTHLRGLGAAVLEVQRGRFEVGEVESATYFVTKPISR